VLAEKSFQLEAQEKTLKWKFVRNAIPSIPGFSGLSMSADGLIGLKKNMGCKQRPAVVAGEKAERKLCFLRKYPARRDARAKIKLTSLEHRASSLDILDEEVAGWVNQSNMAGKRS
jgi:hypothetical protein